MSDSRGFMGRSQIYDFQLQLPPLKLRLSIEILMKEFKTVVKEKLVWISRKTFQKQFSNFSNYQDSDAKKTMVLISNRTIHSKWKVVPRDLGQRTDSCLFAEKCVSTTANCNTNWISRPFVNVEITKRLATTIFEFFLLWRNWDSEKKLMPKNEKKNKIITFTVRLFRRFINRNFWDF